VTRKKKLRTPYRYASRRQLFLKCIGTNSDRVLRKKKGPAGA